MKRSAAYLTAVIAALPSAALAQCPPESQLNECELALFETATILDSRNKESKVLLRTCEDKMEIRTSTVIREIILPCPEPELDAPADLLMLLGTGVAGLLVGTILGMLAH